MGINANDSLAFNKFQYSRERVGVDVLVLVTSHVKRRVFSDLYVI